jgi:nucleoside phosphorylase
VFAVLAGVLAAVVVMVGCGGGGDSSSTVEEGAVTKSHYLKQADAVCEKGEEELQADFATFLKEKENVKKATKADYAELIEKVVVPNISAEIDELRELEVPQGDAGQVEAMWNAREESIATAEGEPEAVIAKSEEVFGHASKLASDYGLKVCASR